MKTSYEKQLHSQFQPAAIEIIESPPSPIGRVSIWMIFIIFMSAIVWACIGEVDQIASARGKVIPHGQVKTLQTSDQGVITGIFVEEGDIVKKGQTLLQLDSTFSEIDFATAHKRLETIELEKALLEMELNDEQVDDLDETTLNSSELAYHKQLRRMRQEEYKEKALLYEIEISKALKEKEKAEIDLEYFKKQEDILEEQVSRNKALLESGSLSRIEYEDKVSELELMQNKVHSAQVLITSTDSTIAQANQNLITLEQSYRTELIQMIVQKDKELVEAQSDLEKMEKKFSMHNLEAPVSGRVSGIGAHTIGGVVTSAQPIVTIVPEGTPLVIEAKVLNKDIGFIEEGQACDIKLDAFSFQRYGVATGKITYISPDAFEDERLGYVYTIRIKPDEEFIPLENKTLNMTPGMTASVEVKLDKRKIIEFFLPAIDYVKESFEL
ncbi:HlyD family type I secretion periplasmic adaptor subunit [Fusibacter sp. JL216-2]|uniref:HlyD family type I secretion periplasmic adaptor subunit n=1 Tax=Fusibacter sp. JL216-2 TaxID=3071453 RepID=UPI003D34F440